MSKTKMSMHRVIAEIKNLEAKVGEIPSHEFIKALVDGDSDVQKTAIAEMTKKSQQNMDKFQSVFKNLASLKAARNLSNSQTEVTIAGRKMTVDEALAQKASVPYLESLVSTLHMQFVREQNRVDQSNAQLDAKINTQIASAAQNASGKALSKEVIETIRTGLEKDQKLKLVHVQNLKDQIEKIKDEMERFNVEVDYVLSESNATTFVEVAMV